MKKIFKKSVFIITTLIGQAAFSQSKNTIWYKEPAQYFHQSLIMGNDKMGASIFGGVNTDTIYLNDVTLWSG